MPLALWPGSEHQRAYRPGVSRSVRSVRPRGDELLEPHGLRAGLRRLDHEVVVVHPEVDELDADASGADAGTGGRHRPFLVDDLDEGQAVGARGCGKGRQPGDRSGEDEDQPLHATSFIRGILAASGMIRAASTSNHCSESEE